MERLEHIREYRLDAGTYFIGGKVGTVSVRVAIAISDTAKTALRRRLLHGDPLIIEYFPYRTTDGLGDDDQILGVPMNESSSITKIEEQLLQV